MPRLADPALSSRRRAQILDAALTRFRERGFRQTTIEEICAEARISPGALYRYFDSKADLIAAIALDARAEAESILERIDGAERLLEGLGDLAQAFFQTFGGDDGDGALLADVWAEAARDSQLAMALLTRDEACIARMTAAIERAQASREIYPAIPAREVAETLMAALEGTALRRALRRATTCDEDVRSFRTLALHLLKPKR